MERALELPAALVHASFPSSGLPDQPTSSAALPARACPRSVGRSVVNCGLPLASSLPPVFDINQRDIIIHPLSTTEGLGRKGQPDRKEGRRRVGPAPERDGLSLSSLSFLLRLVHQRPSSTARSIPHCRGSSGSKLPSKERVGSSPQPRFAPRSWASGGISPSDERDRERDFG